MLPPHETSAPLIGYVQDVIASDRLVAACASFGFSSRAQELRNSIKEQPDPTEAEIQMTIALAMGPFGIVSPYVLGQAITAVRQFRANSLERRAAQLLPTEI